LTIDPYSRRAVLNVNVPNENVIDTRDEPCTICLNYQIRNGKLQCTCVMRSNDVNFGLRNDLGFFIYLQKYIAKRLGVGVGSYTHFAMSIHFYDKDFKMIKDIAYGTNESDDECLDIEMLINNKDELIDYIDNKFIDKDSFTMLLREYGIIYDR
jgi:thymidylate synthase